MTRRRPWSPIVRPRPAPAHRGCCPVCDRRMPLIDRTDPTATRCARCAASNLTPPDPELGDDPR
jgi:hypothetical protein